MMLWLYIKTEINGVSFTVLPTGKGNGSRHRNEGLQLRGSPNVGKGNHAEAGSEAGYDL